MRQNKNFVLYGKDKYGKKITDSEGNEISVFNMMPEEKIKVVNGEFYTSLYSFEAKKNNIRRTEKETKELGLVFDRIIFDLDSKENPHIAIEQAFSLESYLNRMFPELYTEVWFSGNAGAHLYMFFKPIKVKHPKDIVETITKLLHTEHHRIDLKITDIYSRLIRGLGSINPKSGLHKIQISKDMSMDEIRGKAKTKPKTIPVEKYNYSEKWETGVLNIDDNVGNKEEIHEFEPVALNETLSTLFGKYFVEGQMNDVGYPLIHCFKRANTPKEKVIEFFSGFKCNHNVVESWINYAYDNEGINLAGLNKLRENLEKVGAKESDIQKIIEFFKSSNPIEEMRAKINQYLGKRVKVEYGQSLLASYLKEMGIDSRLKWREWYRYTDEGGYEHLKPEEIKKILNEEFPNINISERDISNAMGFLGNIPTPTYNIVQFNNCMYDMKKHKVIDNDEKIFTLVKSPYDYNPTAKPKYLKKFFESSLSKIELDAILEIIGYLFTSGNEEQIMIWFLGIGGSGKTVLANVISAIFKGLICNVDFSRMGERFAKAPFVTAHLNIVGEVDSHKKIDKKHYRDASGDGAMEVEKKGIDSDTLEPEEVPKSIQVANNMPDFSSDLTILQRFIVIQFEKTFRNTEEQIVGLDKKIIESKGDMEWLIYSSLEAYRKMCEKKEKNKKVSFKLRKTPEETQEAITNNNNPLLPAIEQLIEYRQFEQEDTQGREDWREIDATETSNLIPVNELEEVLKKWIPEQGYNLETNKQGKIYHKKILDAIKTVFDLEDNTMLVKGFESEYKSLRKTVNGKKVSYYPFLVPTQEYKNIIKKYNIDIYG